MTQTVTTLDNGDKQIIITGTETWTFPPDWNDYANKIEAYGAGGNGAAGLSSRSGGGGGGGAYTRISNIPIKLYSQTPNPIDGQPTAIISPINTTNSSVGGFNFTFFTLFTTDADGTAVLYYNGVGCYPGASATGTNGGFGGGSTDNTPVEVYYQNNRISYPKLVYSQSSGGNGRTSTTAAGGGGGGAAGPNGAGGAGGTNTTTLGTTGRGGGGGNGGTAGSSTAATAGTAGTGAGAGGTGGAASTSGTAGGGITVTATTTVFSGGGGGGAGDGTTTTTGGAGGLYGGGGGGGASSTISTGGLGSIGALIITYTPIVVSASNKFFLMF